MRKRTRAALCAALLSFVAACGEAETATLVASAGDYELTADDVVEMLVDEEGLPTQAGVVRSLAELWVDYTLLADAAAEDSTFADLDFSGLIQPLVEQMMIVQLRDSAVQVDTTISADELEQLYAADAPAVELRARHILLTYPPAATEAQRDSVRARLEEIRSRIEGGASFADMARTYSQDPGTAAAGGDLGTFGRGDMVAPFEEAVMALAPGEVSEVVQTPLGLHLILLEERRSQSFQDVADDFRLFVQAQRTVSAESTFIAGLEGRSSPELAAGALGVARELARSPETRLTGRAAQRALVEWAGGAFTAGELLAVFRAEQPGLRDEVIASTDDDLEGFLMSQARRQLLVAEAISRGLEPARTTIDSLVVEARTQLRRATGSLGLLSPDQAPGEERAVAIARAVREALADNLSGATNIVPLGPIGFQLREGVPVAIYDAGVGQVLLRVAQARATRAPSAVEQGTVAPREPADTVAR